MGRLTNGWARSAADTRNRRRAWRGGGYSGAAGDFGGGMQSRMQSANTYNSPGWKRMQDRAGERGILWWSMSVVIIVMIIPVIILAIILQRYISKGLLLGAVKG